ncbi:hypothetical protein ACLIBG_05680 [Virgibacillus sp. W0181]|uniref:hypothetical protein n=1 Tax=Virgibacillus sp. W0181 TaxID=3391581 RepID=UPI003F48DAAE
MHYNEYPYSYDSSNDNEVRQFNLPGYLGGQMWDYMGNQLFGPRPPYNQPPDGPGAPFPGAPPFQDNPFPNQGPNYPNTGQMSGPPAGPPPGFTPVQQQQDFQTFAIDPGAIRGCLYRYTYVWLRRDAFWFYPVYVGRNSISGYRWTGNRWVYFGIDLDKIESFQCF